MTRSREVSKGATRVEYVYTATAGQTSFTGSDANSNTLAYTVGQIDVFLNGVRLAAADITASNGTAVVLGVGAEAGDTLNINAFGTFSVTDTLAVRGDFDYTATAGQTTFTGSDNDSQTLSYVAGRIDVYLNGSHLMDTDDYVATNGTSVVLQAGAQVGDTLQVITHGTVNLISHIPDAAIDMNGLELILDADADTSITADTDDQIDFRIGGADIFQMTAAKLDLNGKELVLDADADTSITADTDDVIDFKIANTDHMSFGTSSGDTVIKPTVDAKDIIFQQFDGTSILEINDGAYAKFTAAAVNPEATLTDASTITWNALTQSVAKVTLGANRTMGLASGGVTGAFISLLVIQDGTGSRTVTWNAAYEFTGNTAPTLTTTANLGDLFTFRYNGAKWLETGRNLALVLS